jgi:hypothetical protein
MGRTRSLTLAIALSALSCTQQPAPGATAPDRLDRIEGRVMEVVDSPPYAFLRLKTEAGPVWTAVPIGHPGLGSDVVVTGGVAVRNHLLPAKGRRLEVVYLGRVAAR